MAKCNIDRHTATTSSAACKGNQGGLVAVLHTVADGIVKLNGANSLDEKATQALDDVGGVLGVERILVLEFEPGRNAPCLTPRYQWTRTDTMPLDQASLSGCSLDSPDVSECLARLRGGEYVLLTPQIANAAAAGILEKRKLASILLIPIFEGARYWGHISFHSSDSSRIWSEAEIDIVRMLASSIGTATHRAGRINRHVETLTSSPSLTFC